MSLAGVVFSVIFCYIGYLMVIKQYAQKSTALEISMGIVYMLSLIHIYRLRSEKFGLLIFLIEFT